MELEKLEKMKYKELQKMAKKVGVKANLPKAELLQALVENNLGGSGADQDAELSLVPLEESKLDATFESVNESEQNALNETFEKEAVNSTFEKNEAEVLNRTFEKEDSKDSTIETLDEHDITLETLDSSENNSRFVEFMERDEEDEVNFRVTKRRTRSIEKASVTSSPVAKPVARKSVGRASMTPRDYLSSKNRTPLRKTAKTPGSIQKKTESQIPRFVKFAQKGKVGKIPDFAKMHEKNFKKMDSLDTYVEKKKKLTDTITKQLEKAKALSIEHNSLVKQLKSKTPRNTDTTDSKFVPAVTSTAKMNLNFGTENPSKQSFKFGSSDKTAEPFKFTAKPIAAAPRVVPKVRQDLKSSTMPKPKTKDDLKPSRKSLSKPTPNKPLLNITNNANRSINKSLTGTPSKKFDLAASLAKPLTYKPHTGKLKVWESKKKDKSSNVGSITQEETKQRQMQVIKGVRMNKRAELLMMRRKMSN